ncbi:hypothetical protein J7M23_04345, partial [Candidatus Sumerlaeota bacterium]|nr:hypothetical protein [Candidatus Sumerlaeota bacterium]
ISPRLRDEYKASIGILKDINQFKKAGTLEVRQYKHYPLCSIIISDGKLLQYNPYTHERQKWDEADVYLSRGLQSKLLIYTKKRSPKKFKEIQSIFESIWRGGKPLKL